MAGRSKPIDSTEQGYIEAERDAVIEPTHIRMEDSGIPQAPKGGRRVATQVRRPHIAATLGTIDNILWAELKDLERKKMSGQHLEDWEIRRFVALGELATKVIREEREQVKQEKLDDLTEAELLLRAEEARRLLGGG